MSELYSVTVWEGSKVLMHTIGTIGHLVSIERTFNGFLWRVEHTRLPDESECE